MDSCNHDNQENVTPQQYQRPGINAAKRMQDALTESDAEKRQLHSRVSQLEEELMQARLLEQWRTEERRAKRQRRKENKARKMIDNDCHREAPGAPKAERGVGAESEEYSEVSIGDLLYSLTKPSPDLCHELFSKEEVDEAMAELEELEKELEKEKPPPCCSWGGSSSSSGSPPPPPPPPPSPAIC